MSFEVRGWVARQIIKPASAKYVLFAMADRAADFNCLFASISEIRAFTCLDRKTIIACWKLLQERGYLIDSGHRVGRTKQIVVWWLKDPRCKTFEEFRKRYRSENPLLQAADIEDEITPEDDEESQERDPLEQTVPKTDLNGTAFSSKQSQKRTETVPKTGHGTVLTSLTLREQEGRSNKLIEAGEEKKQKPSQRDADPDTPAPRPMTKAELEHQRDRFNNFANRYIFANVTPNQWRRQHFEGNPPTALVFPADEQNPDERPMRKITLFDLATAAH